MSAIALQAQAESAPAPMMPSSTPATFLEQFFAELDRRGIVYVILHSYENLPHEIDGSDVDLAVAHAQLDKIPALIAAIARSAGWVVAQRIEHELFANYTLVIDPNEPSNYLALDVCSHFARGGALLMADSVLLAHRRRHARGFFIPAPDSECIYLRAKSLAKNSAPGKHAHRLRELLRRARRALRPAGLHIALLGPDGSGKSTLLRNLEHSLGSCFPRHQIFRFRPDLFNQIEPGVQPAPHERPPRNRFVSCLKALYYFGDCWAGLVLRLWPERHRGTLIIFDRDFNDLAVDQRRYLVQGIAPFAELLRRFAPKADATFILDGDARSIHARKPELPVEELERQRQAFRRMAEGDRRMHLVSADKPAREIAAQVTRAIIQHLAYRELRRDVPFAKRLFDIIAATLALFLLSPLLALLALLVRVQFGAPILFSQERPGLGGKPFIIWKFRTMPDARDFTGRMLPDAERLTVFGKFLRSTSLDELPELVNVLRGEMSLVGPRPLLMRYLPLYSAEQMRRHDALPGITGWAQINGRNAATWPQKFALDLWYVDHQSFRVDLKILALTFWKVLKREGISQPGRATADFFLGPEGGPLPARAESRDL